MSKLKIIIAPDERLNQLSKEVKKIDNKILNVLDNMLECMYLNNGIGLAAPQVGILKRLVVVDCGTEEKKPLKFINPEIVNISQDMAEYEEGCLSLPQQFAKVVRPEKVTIKYISTDGEQNEKKFKGIEATCIQHEIDHLNGKLFIDYLSKLKKDMIIKKLVKHKKELNKIVL